MGIIALLFLKAGWNRLQNWLATNKEVAASPGWSFDWNSVTPGKALAEYVGPAWVNWIIWPIVALVVFLIIRAIYRTFFVKAVAGAKPADSGSSFGWVILMTIGFGALAALSTYLIFRDPLPALVKVEFPKINGEVGQAVATGGYETTYKVSYPSPPPNTMKVWDVCVVVTKPEVVTAALYFDRSPVGMVQTIRFADRTKEVLMRQGRLSQSIEVTFNYVLVPMGTKDVCAAYQQKMLVDLAK